MGVWEVAPVVAVAAGSTVVVTWGWGLWQRARTPSDGALITVDEVDCTTKKLTSVLPKSRLILPSLRIFLESTRCYLTAVRT